ncbi:MAG TPA: hypothetical protein GXZ77_01325, partial [Papillibacter sp.]|nr:hypothetical protein [Papillibacter sp.]
TITYTLGGGAAEGNSGSYTVESEPVTLKEPARNGYTFTGWTGTGIGSTPTKNVTVPISGFANHLSLTANWSAIPYTITYNDVDGATNSNPSDYTIESSFVLTAPEKDGYDFLGWTGTGIAGSTPKLDVTITSGTTGPLVFTAHWQVSDFKIRSVADLIKLRDQVSSGTWGERTAILETDLQLPVDWEGIGSGQNPFTGVFDGNNHTITYNGSDTAYQNAPLFRTNSGTIENLKITIQGVVRVNGSFGAVTVANSKGTIRNCHVAPADDTDSRIVQNNSQGTLGGVVADNSGDSSVAGKIINCSVGRSASSPLVLEREGNMFTGGVVGANTGSTLGSFPPPALIEYTTAFVNPFSNDAGIYVKFITKAEGSTPGGIAGYNTRAKIQFGKSVNIYASFKAESQMQYLGGIAGSTSTVEIIGPGPGTYVNVTCNVESSHDKVYVGGIAGSSWSISGRYIHVNPMDLSDLKSGVCDINQNTLFMEGDYIGLVGFFEYIKGPESYYDVFGSYYG